MIQNIPLSNGLKPLHIVLHAILTGIYYLVFPLPWAVIASALTGAAKEVLDMKWRAYGFTADWKWVWSPAQGTYSWMDVCSDSIGAVIGLLWWFV